MAICELLGDHLNHIRKEKGLSITAFANELQISRSSLQTILNGTGNPRCDTIDQIAAQLELGYLELLSGPKGADQFYLNEQQQSDLLLLLERLSVSQEDHHE